MQCFVRCVLLQTVCFDRPKKPQHNWPALASGLQISQAEMTKAVLQLQRRQCYLMQDLMKCADPTINESSEVFIVLVCLCCVCTHMDVCVTQEMSCYTKHILHVISRVSTHFAYHRSIDKSTHVLCITCVACEHQDTLFIQ